MNIRDFEYLIAIDELKSFVKASKKCFISQPALSQQVKKIEEQLGFNIFERDRKNTITTKKGKEVIKHAKSIVNCSQRIKDLNNDNKSLRIGLIPTICPYLLPHIINSLQQDFPKVKFYFLELKTADIIKKLQEGEIDMGIIAYFEELIDEKMHYSKLYDEEFLLALPKSSNLTLRDFPKIMQDKQLILLEEGNCMSDNIKNICSIYSQNSFSDFYATNIETVKNMVKINNGAALLPKLSCLNEDNLKLSSFKPKKHREIGVISRKNFEFTDLVESVSKLIPKCVENINR